jgi:hypothetical protein
MYIHVYIFTPTQLQILEPCKNPPAVCEVKKLPPGQPSPVKPEIGIKVSAHCSSAK